MTIPYKQTIILSATFHNWLTAYSKSSLCILLLFIVFGCTSPEKKIALVIGNQNYTHIKEDEMKLTNTAQDAVNIKKALEASGFEIFPSHHSSTEYQTAGHLRETILNFNDLAEDADIALFYYSGHAIQYNDSNWLLPTNANINKESDLKDMAVNLDNVLLTYQHDKKRPERTNIIILDACRTNPFHKQATGLADVVPDPESLIAFATSPGKVAKDSGYYSAAFQRILSEMGGLRIQRVFDFIRQEVGYKTEQKQIPMYHTNVSKDVFFNKKKHAHFVFSY
jgi:uncharacterized caspase-like protein